MRSERPIKTISRDSPSRVDAGGGGVLEPRKIERGKGPIGPPHEATAGYAIIVMSRDSPIRVDAGGPYRSGTRRIERRKGTM